MVKTPRFTFKYILNWLQEEFERLEIKWEPIEMYYTRFRSQDYESGAPVYIIRIRHKDNPERITTVLVHDWLRSMEKWVKTGQWMLTWEPKDRYTITDSIITLKKT